MMRPILKGSVDQSVVVRIVDSTDGTPETGVVYNTSGIDLWYRREGAVRTSITEATLTNLNDAHSDGGVLHIGDGYYRIDLPDAAVATGANGVMVGGTVTGMVVIGCYVPLFDVNPYDAVRMGMTALPNANAAAGGGLPILGTNATAIAFTAGMTISNAGGDALSLSSSGSNGSGLASAGNGTGAGIKATAGATGNGVQAIGGATSGSAIKASGTAGNAIALELAGQGSAAGLSATGGATGEGIKAVGGGTSGDGIKVTTTSGHGLNLAPVGTNMHGLLATGGNGGTSDGIKAAAGTGGVDLRANQTGNLVGTVSTVTTLTGHTAQTGDAYARLGAPVGASISADIAAAKANLVTIIAAIGAFTGTGVNTILGFFRAIMRKDATLPSDIGGTYDSATDSLEFAQEDAANLRDFGIMQVTTIASLTSQTVFRLTDASPDDDAYNGAELMFTDQTTEEQKSVAVAADYDGSDKEITLQEAPVFTIAVGDHVTIKMPPVGVFKRRVDGTVTFEQSVRLQNSAAGAKASGMATTTAVIRDLADSKDRITATVDANGNRTAVTRDLT